MADLIFVGQYIASKVGATGLTVTVDVDRYTISDGSRSSLVTAGSATEGRRGLYHYRLASADLSLYQYVATFITSDATVDQQQIAALGLVVPDALVSSRLAPAGTLATVTTVNGLAAGAITAAAIATGAIDADALAADAVAEIADGVLDEATAGHTTAGSFGKLVIDISTVVSLLNTKLGAWTGTGVNTLLGAFKAALSKAATLPTDIGGTFDPAADSTEALRDRGDAAWITATGFATPTNITAGTITTVSGNVEGGVVGNVEGSVLGSVLGNVEGNVGTAASVTNPVTLENGAIKAVTFDGSTAFPVTSADTGATRISRTGADSDTLETLSDQIDAVSAGSGATAQQVWEYVTRTLTQSSTSITDSTAAGSIARRRGDSWSMSLTIGAITGYTSLWFTAKWHTMDTDAQSILQIKKNASGLLDGLLYVNGAAATDATKASITVSNAATGAIIVAVDEMITDDLPPTGAYYDVQVLNAGTVTTPESGTLTISADVTRSVA